MAYCECGRVFKSAKDQIQHQRYWERKRESSSYMYLCHVICCRPFSSKRGLLSHQVAKNHWTSIEERTLATTKRVCPCGKVCHDAVGLEQHQQNSKKHFKKMAKLNQNNTPLEMPSNELKRSKAAIQELVTTFYDREVRVEKDDKKDSVATVRGTLSTMMEYVREQPGGEIYNPGLIKAGSHAVNTKIGKVDEFDWLVPLDVNRYNIILQTTGSVPYSFDAQESNMNITMTTNDGTSAIPTGYAAVHFKSPIGVPSNWLQNNYIISRYVKTDLYNKIRTALEDSGLYRNGVHISREAHGPALTLSIMPPTASTHHISIDLVPSLPSTISLRKHGWPRKATKKVFTQDTIRSAKEAGTHLVPKKDGLFDISYSKAEKALLENIDLGSECRKKCHKVIKKYVSTFRSQSPAAGISSHFFKHQLLNMIEAHPKAGYWDEENFGERVVDMLQDSESLLRSGRLPNHFKRNENVLQGKDRAVLNRLADFFEQKRIELEHL